MTTEPTIIDADDGYTVAVPCGDSNGNVGFAVSEVVAWRIDGHQQAWAQRRRVGVSFAFFGKIYHGLVRKIRRRSILEGRGGQRG